MMEQSTQTININERPKKKKGRPKGTALYTQEEAKERARQRARLNYSSIFEKNEKERDYNIMQKQCLNLYYCLNFIFEFHLNN